MNFQPIINLAIREASHFPSHGVCASINVGIEGCDTRRAQHFIPIRIPLLIPGLILIPEQICYEPLYSLPSINVNPREWIKVHIYRGVNN